MRPLELAVHGTGDPWGVLAKAFQEIERRASDDARKWIADVVVRASQKAMKRSVVQRSEVLARGDQGSGRDR